MLTLWKPAKEKRNICTDFVWNSSMSLPKAPSNYIISLHTITEINVMESIRIFFIKSRKNYWTDLTYALHKAGL